MSDSNPSLGSTIQIVEVAADFQANHVGELVKGLKQVDKDAVKTLAVYRQYYASAIEQAAAAKSAAFAAGDTVTAVPLEAQAESHRVRHRRCAGFYVETRPKQ